MGGGGTGRLGQDVVDVVVGVLVVGAGVVVGADEALLVTPHGRVLEGPTWSFFWVAGGILRTPPLEERILASITRARLLECCDVREETLVVDDLRAAEEAFIASTVREVQTLSMPVTMAQVVLFGFASLGVGNPRGAEAIGAAIFPLSSPFAMLGRAAEEPALWPHLLAFLWQALWVALILHVAAGLFRRSVLKSGQPVRWFWQRRSAL